MEYKEFSAKTVDDAITAACQDFFVTSDKLDYEVVEEGSSGFLGIGAKPAVIKASVKKSSVEEVARVFLNDVFQAMNMEVEIEISIDEDGALCADLRGEHMGILIGKRGQTLDSLQYLANRVANKHQDGYVRVKLDTENYRARREETLKHLAKNIAHKVKRNRRPVALEPMNPYERRIIHSALQGNKYVETVSEGEEPYRHVVVKLKRW